MHENKNSRSIARMSRNFFLETDAISGLKICQNLMNGGLEYTGGGEGGKFLKI